MPPLPVGSRDASRMTVSARRRGSLSRYAVLAVAVAVFLADRLVQAWVTAHMVLGGSIPVVGRLLSLTLLENRGAAFSLFPGADWLFIGVAGLVLVGGLGLVFRRPRLSSWIGLATGLVMGGAAGNLFDRLVSGRVVDYIHVEGFAVFNLADSAIVVGMAILLWEAWHRDHDFG